MVNALIIDMDEYKSGIDGYDPKAASKVQSGSARLANKAFDVAIKEGRYKKVILMCGGSASGKTEFVRSHLFAEEAIIFDSTLSTFSGAEIKIKKCLKKNLEVEVCFVFPDDLRRAYIAFKNRERVIPESIFAKTHIGSRQVILELSENFANLNITLVKSYYDSNILRYTQIMFIKKAVMLKYINSLLLNQKQVIDLTKIL